MIPDIHILEWRQEAPWVAQRMIEQDLVISRAVVDIFSEPLLAGALAFRGGTALHKLHLAPAVRYSEDIDLVQVSSGPIGLLFDGGLGVGPAQPRADQLVEFTQGWLSPLRRSLLGLNLAQSREKERLAGETCQPHYGVINCFPYAGLGMAPHARGEEPQYAGQTGAQRSR